MIFSFFKLDLASFLALFSYISHSSGKISFTVTQEKARVVKTALGGRSSSAKKCASDRNEVHASSVSIGPACFVLRPA